MTALGTDDETSEGSIAIAREILASWGGRSLKKIHRERHAVVNEAHIPMTYGFAAHAHLLGETAVDLVEQGKVLQAYPLVRLVYECALRAQWMALSKDAPEAISNEMARSQRAISLDLAKAGSAILRDGAGTLPYEDAEKLETTANEAARSFRQMCLELEPGGTDAYVYYRLLSEYSHASLQVTDCYVIESRSGAESPASLLAEVKQRDRWMPAGFVVWSLIWAGSAFDYLVAGHPRRRELQVFAERTGVPAMLRLKPEVAQRRFAASKAAKDADRAAGRRRVRDRP